MPARLYVDDTLLKGLAQDLEDVAAELRPFTQAAHAVVRPRHLARRRHRTAADQPHAGDGVRRGAARAPGDEGGARTGASASTCLPLA